MITVVYYTSNREEDSFEQKIRRSLLETIGSLFLISVSQKPIDFGHNICVGNIGTSDMNVLRQLLAGCEAANTPLVATAEADCLYPPVGYFDFRPDDIEAVYRYTNLWILRRGWGHYRKKKYSLCAQVSGREYLIRCIKNCLERKHGGDFIHKKAGWKPFESALPCVNIKTGYGMRRKTGTIRDMVPELSLPHWGVATELEKELFNN